MTTTPASATGKLPTEIGNRPGLIPVGLSVRTRELIWRDLGVFHCYDAFFLQSLLLLDALNGAPATTFRSPLTEIDRTALGEVVPPSAFIFHAGRCGSTLLSKSLARSRANMVFSEADPHNRIWEVFAEDGACNAAIYRGLLLAMGRKRVASYRHHIIKFTSFNVLRFAFIRSVFPEVPAIFLFREPGAIVRSCRLRPPSWMAKRRGIHPDGPPEEFVHKFFACGLRIEDPLFRRLSYASLTTDRLPSLLSFLNIEVADSDLPLMRNEFRWDSKSGLAPSHFVADQTAVASRADLVRLHNDLVERADADWP